MHSRGMIENDPPCYAFCNYLYVSHFTFYILLCTFPLVFLSAASTKAAEAPRTSNPEDTTTSPSTIRYSLSTKEREALDKWIDEYLAIQGQRERGRLEMANLIRQLREENQKRDAVPFDPRRASRIEGVMVRFHTLTDEDATRRKRLDILNKETSGKTQKLLVAIEERLNDIETKLKRDARLSRDKKQIAATQAEELRKLQRFLVHPPTKEKIGERPTTPTARLNAAFFGQLQKRLDQLDASLGQIDALGGESEDEILFLLDLMDAVSEEGAKAKSGG